ncbi:nischarin-like [Arctopsyche grandis]|uniref:nischarin-like n=1 Tax=Arctopsyche grandis TaxID=121162 RepID=UPI00406D93F5
MSCYTQYYKDDASVTVYDSEDVDNVTFYKIRVNINKVTWTLTHRYKDFDELHSRLVVDHGVTKDLLPPKKAIRNRCPKFIEQRREALDTYLKSVFNYLQLTMPREFATFLEFPQYDTLFIFQQLALKFFIEGDKLLASGEFFELFAIELFAISQRLKQACSSFELADRKYDFSHVLDFCSQLKKLIVRGESKHLGNSNIIPNTLGIDMSPFKTIQKIAVFDYPMHMITCTGTLRDTLKSLHVNFTEANKISDIVLCDFVHKEVSDDDNDNLIWKELQEVNFGCNYIMEIDSSIKLLPKLQTLTMRQNKLTDISNLSSLPQLSYLDLSENLFSKCEDWHSKLGKISTINLSQNKISSLAGFSKLYSLENLDLSCNVISDVEEVQHICKLPCLENLRLTANPVASVVDYRVKVIEQFNNRMSDICLDSEKPSEKELDTARVLQALRIVKEGKTPNFFNSNDHVYSTFTAQGGSGL